MMFPRFLGLGTNGITRVRTIDAAPEPDEKKHLHGLGEAIAEGVAHAAQIITDLLVVPETVKEPDSGRTAFTGELTADAVETIIRSSITGACRRRGINDDMPVSVTNIEDFADVYGPRKDGSFGTLSRANRAASPANYRRTSDAHIRNQLAPSRITDSPTCEGAPSPTELNAQAAKFWKRA